MKILQIGAGSMGTRRLRDLAEIADIEIEVHDPRPDRLERARERFGVRGFPGLDDAMAWGPEALVISTPPGTKGPYIDLALAQRRHHFTEADIWSYDSARILAESAAHGLVSAPSCSFAFLPLVQRLAPIVRDELGALLAYESFMATYMPAWHPGEGAEYYARHRATAPAREMICFELHWLQHLFGPAAAVAGDFARHGDLPGGSEDTWSVTQRLRDGGNGHLAVTMACPADYRHGTAYGTRGRIAWDIYRGDYSWQLAGRTGPQAGEAGAMADVLEGAYADEIGAFVAAVRGGPAWVHTYADSQQASATLAAAEASAVRGTWEPVDLARSPEPEPPAKN